MARLSQEKINEIRQSVDTIKPYVLFMMIKILQCQYRQTNRFSCVLFVIQEVMFLPSYKNT